ncbi:methyltransferase domain-containing protein, partial [Streptomyces sp. NPDC006639]|uniref:methyltransferase domain-containing protein n=1 Tax=Streptomyces sp. NPDC006639 TaxID=3364753 RepID=UPI00369E916D
MAQASTAGVYVHTHAVYSHDESAALYDLLSPGDPVHPPGDAFHDELIEGADSVLDLGCGTGAMLHWSREHGHTGRLVGLDPDRAALALARRRTDIEWVDGTAADGTVLRIDRTSLRFLDTVTLDRFLAESGFVGPGCVHRAVVRAPPRARRRVGPAEFPAVRSGGGAPPPRGARPPPKENPPGSDN